MDDGCFFDPLRARGGWKTGMWASSRMMSTQKAGMVQPCHPGVNFSGVGIVPTVFCKSR